MGTARAGPLPRLWPALRSPWLMPAAWLAGMAAATVLVVMPAATGLAGVVIGGVSFALALVLVASVVAVAAALAAAAGRRLLGWLAAAGARARSAARGRPS